jgi:NADH:ubiquinone oxidoreductase subunit F (NADH-binding)/(2Fe-2S) ferredoxin/Pyruvate/2-oxoacid:ferredoxin oxidoreductase delta subunit
MPRLNTPAELEEFRKGILSSRNPQKPCIAVCTGTGCIALGATALVGALKDEIKKMGLDVAVLDLRETGCPGFCERGPIMVIYPEETCYVQVQAKDAAEIVSETVANRKVIDRLLYVDPVTNEKAIRESDIPFYRNQRRLLLGNNIKLDPKSIDSYFAVDGYSAFVRALFDMRPEQIIDAVKASGLRGRGGAGFSTGMKWEFARRSPGDLKYVVVNADEGDPGAFMDRALLEGNPHAVLEGLAIGAFAIGAAEGYIYVRQEYPLAVENITIAIQQAESSGLLGKNILGSGFDFSVHVHRGAGAFVCGEETALLMSLEGKPGEPRPRPPFPAVKGLHGRPTNINNVETWANIPLIINYGAEFLASIGTGGSKGTKIFSLVGKVNNTGLVEVPMGITLRDIIYKVGGGIPKEKRFKAVQTGGPSGGCIPSDHLDIPVDFDELTKVGAIMGSGGMIVMDEDTCMVDVARYFLNFLTEESCGKCTPCREGIRQMLKILTNISQGKGKEGDVELLEDLAETTKLASLCALGGSAPNPVLSTIRYFRDEYDAHIKERKCPAFVCKELISYCIDPEKCQACMICLRKCPTQAIAGAKSQIHVINQEKCNSCGTCFEVCPSRFSAVRRLSGEPVPPPVSDGARMLARETPV